MSAARVCAGPGCSIDISDRGAQARFCSGACQRRESRARAAADPQYAEPTYESTHRADLCDCGGILTDLDPEGEIVCVTCGRYKTFAGREVNGYDRRMRHAELLMRTEAELPVRAHRRERRKRADGVSS